MDTKIILTAFISGLIVITVRELFKKIRRRYFVSYFFMHTQPNDAGMPEGGHGDIVVHVPYRIKSHKSLDKARQLIHTAVESGGDKPVQRIIIQNFKFLGYNIDTTKNKR